jgi:hypothetical protein
MVASCGSVILTLSTTCRGCAAIMGATLPLPLSELLTIRQGSLPPGSEACSQQLLICLCPCYVCLCQQPL